MAGFLFELVLVLTTFLDGWVGGFGGMEQERMAFHRGAI